MLRTSTMAKALSAVTGNPLLVVAAVFSLLLVTVYIRVLYNLYFHPLRKYPGPKLWAATHLTWTYYRCTGQLVWKSIELHRKYGSVVRVAPDQLSYTTDTAWKTIYGMRAVEMEKNTLAGFSKPGIKGAHHVLSADKINHARLRRVLAPAMSDKAMRAHDGMMMSYADLLVEKLKARCGDATVNINEYFNWITLDIIGDLICGQPDGALQKEWRSPWLDILNDAIESQVLVQALKTYGLVKWRPYLLPKNKAFADMENFKIIGSKFETRLGSKSDTDDRDILGYMLKEEGPNISPVEMRLNSATIIGAGQGATATWLSTCVHSLSFNRDAFRKLKVELRASFSSEAEMTMDRIAKLPYLAAVMDEALRLHCPSPTSTGRFVPHGGEAIDGSWVPAGTTVGVHQHAAYHLEENFYKCDEFHPERWLPTARERGSPFAGDRLDVFHPFSIGPRICLGSKFTTAATRIVLAKMVWHFEWQVLSESTHWRTRQKATMAWHRGPLNCRLNIST